MSERGKYLNGLHTVVIKLGTQLLSDADGRLDAAFVRSIAGQVAELRKRNIFVTVVSSGAIGCGVRELGLNARPTDLSHLQAVAAVGQRRLMDVWAESFKSHGIHVAQLLLTREDIDDRTRFLNLRNTIGAVHELGAVPIVNENDTVSTTELVKITFGDNDILAALVAHALRAELLVLLTGVDGLLDESGARIPLIMELEEAKKRVRAEKSPQGKGGMESKIQAARMVTEAGESLIVASGRVENILIRLVEGEDQGTLFVPPADRKKRSSRSRWIGSLRSTGTIVVDSGAATALAKRNCSLLPAGVVKIEGEFARGDVVDILGPDAKRVARGLSNYSSEDVQKIQGKKTLQVRQILADEAYDEVVHRDNMIVE